VPHMTELVVAPGYRESEREGKGKEREREGKREYFCIACQMLCVPQKICSETTFWMGIGQRTKISVKKGHLTHSD
jgi:hypothetical protein